MPVNLDKEEFYRKKAEKESGYHETEEIYPQREYAEEIYPQGYMQTEEIYPQNRNIGRIENEYNRDVTPYYTAGNLPQAQFENAPTNRQRNRRRLAVVVGLGAAALAVFTVIAIALTTLFGGIFHSDSGTYPIEDVLPVDSYENTKYYEYHNSYKRIEITTKNSSIYIGGSDDESIGVSISERDGVEVTDSAICLNDLSDDAFVYVPNDFLGEIYVKTNNGDVSLNYFNAKNTTVEIGNGNLSLNEFRSSGKVNVKSSNGEINIYDCDFSDSVFSLESGNDEVYISNSTFGSFDVTKDNGELNFAYDSFDDLSVDAGTCEVYFHETDGNTISVDIQNGNITGELKGYREEYKTTSRVKNGSDTLGTGGHGDKTVSCSVSNGDIKLRFADKDDSDN